MVNRLLLRLRRWRTVESVLGRISGRLSDLPEDDFEPVRTSPPISTPPATFEMRFMRLHAEARFDEMWDLLVDDAQRAWGGRENFMREMPRMDDVELLDMQVVSVNVMEGWTDEAHQRTYSNVARMVMRYRVRQQWREWTFDRQVHLVPGAGGWRTLCYPARVGTAVGR
jgi:hypothetical protein